MSLRHGDRRRSPEIRNHFVYRYFDTNGVLLYVGCTLRLETRWREHREREPKMAARVVRAYVQGPYNYETARAIEHRAIVTERPEFGRRLLALAS